ncbi:MAG: hypothetical protein QOF76_1746, partial [Solirubrobacteraceae bacterium]|nr:hypothetical protein [Solirubrobacteraceae bacterium]
MRRAGLCALALWACLAGTASAEFGSVPRPTSLALDGPVNAVATSGGVTYVGGSFATVGPTTGAGVIFNTALTQRDATAPIVAGGAGRIDVSIPDGAGGWYIGGDFTQVGSVLRTNLAHIKADNTVDTAFNAGTFEEKATNSRPHVTHLALSGSTLFIGGSFSTIAGTARRDLAAVDKATGALTAFNPAWLNNNPPSGLAVAGTHVYVTGFFNDIGGAHQFNGLAELNAADGTATSWRPGPANGRPGVLAVSPDGGTLYVACSCTFAGNVVRGGIAAFSLSSGALLPLNVEPFATTINTIVQIGNTLYVMGRLTGAITVVSGNRTFNNRAGGAAFDVSGTGTLLPWDPKTSANSTITTAAILNGNLLVGGDFQSVAGNPVRRVAVLDATSGASLAGGLDITGGVNTVATDGTRVFVGGSIVTVDGKRRANLAAFNADGTLAPFAGGVSGIVRALAVAGGKLYAGGDFGNATGQGDAAATGRRHLASFDTADGTLTTFNPDIEGSVSALAADATNLYVAGPLSKIKNVTHGGVAAFALGNDTPLTFDPAPDGGVSALALTGSRLYAGGSFSKLSGLAGTPARASLAAFDLPALSLDAGFLPPAVDRPIYALAASDTAVFAGGAFSNVGATSRARLARFAPADGALTAWNAQVSDSVFALDLAGTTVYAGGAFGLVGGKIRDHAAGIDTETAVPTEWNPAPDRSITAITHDAASLFFAGGFQNVGTVPQNYFAAFAAPGSAGPTPTPTPTTVSSATPTASPTGVPITAGTPGTEITDGPPAFTTATVTGFAFTSDTAGATFQCSLDGAEFAACTTPFVTPALAAGVHSFTVRAVAPDGTIDVGGATQTFTVLEADTGTPSSAAVPSLKVKAKKKIVIGKTKGGFKLTLTAPAYVDILLQRGKRKKKKLKWKTAARMPSSYRKAGRSTVKFNGTVAGTPLRRGRYRARLTATGAGGATATRTVTFKLVPKKAKPHHGKPKHKSHKR